MKHAKNKLMVLVYSVVVALLALVWIESAQAQGRVTWETNYTATVPNFNDGSNSVVSVVLIPPRTSGVRTRVIVETPATGAVAWKLASTLTTGEVANLVAIPASTTREIDLGEGYNGAIAMRFATVASTTNTVKIKEYGN